MKKGALDLLLHRHIFRDVPFKSFTSYYSVGQKRQDVFSSVTVHQGEKCACHNYICTDGVCLYFVSHIHSFKQAHVYLETLKLLVSFPDMDFCLKPTSSWTSVYDQAYFTSQIMMQNHKCRMFYGFFFPVVIVGTVKIQSLLDILEHL